MNKKEAIQAMLEGKKIRPTNWSIGRFVEFNNGAFVDENNDDFDLNNFSERCIFKISKMKVKKTLNGFVNVYSADAYFHNSKEAADRQSGSPNRIACVPVTGEYWVEE